MDKGRNHTFFSQNSSFPQHCAAIIFLTSLLSVYLCSENSIHIFHAPELSCMDPQKENRWWWKGV